MATERELKFSTADDHVPSTLELELALQGSGQSVAVGRVSRHVDVYYDRAGELAAAGMALRSRQSSAGSRVTLKSTASHQSGGAAGAMQRRSELEVQLDEASHEAGHASGATVPAGTPYAAGAASITWPESVLAALPPGLRAEGLAPVAELHIRRVAFLISTTSSASDDTAAPFAELAFDEVTCVAPQPRGTLFPTTSAQFHEVEVEWLGADDAHDSTVMAGLTAVAEAVGTIVKLTSSPVPKLDRARALLAALDDS